MAQEDGKESSVPLDISIKDVNDNLPTFTQPIYIATTKEDIKPGKTILTGNWLTLIMLELIRW